MALRMIDFEYTDDVTVINREQFDAHMRLYEGYINKINEVDELLRDDPDRENANATYSKYRGIKRGETYAMDGVILHEYYFENIGSRNNAPDDEVAGWLANNFGSLEEWEDDFVATAKASRGWAILCYDIRSKRLRNISLDAHDVGNLAICVPILVLDVYEHAYFLQYADDKEEYINNFMNNIDWNVVRRRIGLND